MGQDWVSTGQAWARCLAGCWVLDKDRAGSHRSPLCFLVSGLGGLSCSMEKGSPWQDRADGEVVTAPPEPWVIPLIPGEAVSDVQGNPRPVVVSVPSAVLGSCPRRCTGCWGAPGVP